MIRLTIAHRRAALTAVAILGSAAIAIAIAMRPLARTAVPAAPKQAVVSSPSLVPVSSESLTIRGEPCQALDLDGDGVTDQWHEVPDSCGTGGCQFEVFLTRRGGTDQFVGRMDGHCPFEIEPRNGGPADVLATWWLGTKSITTRYRFARGRYRAHSESRCSRDACTAERQVHR